MAKSMKVRYIKTGHVGYASEKVANIMQKKEKIKILGEVKEKEESPKKEEPKKGK